jgi:tRNA A-37 threonylcarbamoyl transferase component Bud32
MYVAHFRQKFTLEEAIGSHTYSLEACMRVTNSIPLGCSFHLPVVTVNCVQTLKDDVLVAGPPSTIVGNIMSQVDAWCGQVKQIQSEAAAKTERAAAILSTELAKLAAAATGTPATYAATTTAAAPTESTTYTPACSALIAALEAEAVAVVDSTNPSTFPTAEVEVAVSWLENAALEAVHRFETIHTIVAHHATTRSDTSKWLDPASKQQLLDAVDEARKSKKRAHKLLKEAILAVETVDSDDEEEDPDVLAAAVRAAKTALATTSKRNIQVQATLAAAIRDHFPELVTHKAVTAKGSLFQLMGQFGGLPVYDSKEENHTIGAPIQTSGTHEVYRADASSGDGANREVVLKRFRLDDERSRKMFERELRIMARLRHPNIVALTGVVYSVKSAEAYLEMPFFESGDLRQHFAANAKHRSPVEVQQIFFELLKALEYLHSNGVAHLDVKPDNILIANDGTTKLADFDVSKDTASRAYAVGTVAVTTIAVTGLTLAYAPPEVLAHARANAGGTVRVFRKKSTLEGAIGSHACSREANMRVTNGIPLGSSLLLPVYTVNCVQTLKERLAIRRTIHQRVRLLVLQLVVVLGKWWPRPWTTMNRCASCAETSLTMLKRWQPIC